MYTIRGLDETDVIHKPRVAENCLATEGRLRRHALEYNRMVQAVTLGKAAAAWQKPVELARLKPGDAMLDLCCKLGELVLQAKVKAGPGGEIVGIYPIPEMIVDSR